MNYGLASTDRDFLNALTMKIKAIDPMISCEPRVKKVSFISPRGHPKKFSEILFGKALQLRFYSQKEQVSIYPGGVLEISANRKIENYKKLFPGNDCTEAVQLAEKDFRLSLKA